jgi:hypothetical protein
MYHLVMFKHLTKREFAAIQTEKFQAALESEELSQRLKDKIDHKEDDESKTYWEKQFSSFIDRA